jgi:hypothetical protein
VDSVAVPLVVEAVSAVGLEAEVSLVADLAEAGNIQFPSF